MADRPAETDRKWKVFDFEVALKVIQHISTGIYKSAGGVLKELVSNSYDSQAKTVRISTGYPSVRKVTIVDDGWGMREEALKEQFSHIGASLRTREPKLFEAEDENPPDSREQIGMFGVGFLSAAHISKKIRMVTYPKGEDYGLEIFFNLEPYFEYARQVEPLDKFVGGTIRYQRIPAGGEGTRLELDPVDSDSPFRRFLLEEGESFVKWPRDGHDEGDASHGVADLVEGIGSWPIKTIDELRGRERVLWELGLMAPVHYLPGGPIDTERLSGKAEKVVGNIVQAVNAVDFRVYLDGVEVLKPIKLPTPKSAATKWDRLDGDAWQDVRVYSIDIDTTVSPGGKVRAKGYLLFQPHRVVPQELTGIYLRVSGVGVGSYDSRIFRALRSENPIIRVQLSGELYISKGMRQALTLDRSTFNEQDPQFVALRKSVVDRISLSADSIVQAVREVREQRGRRRKRIRSAAEKQERRGSIQEAVETSRPGHSTRFEPQAQVKRVQRSIDYASSSAYPSAERPWLVIDHESKAVTVTERLEEEPTVVAILVSVDELLGQLDDPALWRKRLAKELEKIL